LTAAALIAAARCSMDGVFAGKRLSFSGAPQFNIQLVENLEE
jgi:hypothetical protein